MRGTRAANSEPQPMPILHAVPFPGHGVLPLEPLARLMGARIQRLRAEFWGPARFLWCWSDWRMK